MSIRVGNLMGDPLALQRRCLNLLSVTPLRRTLIARDPVTRVIFSNLLCRIIVDAYNFLYIFFGKSFW